jgi:uncharacterized protein YoxC
MSSFENQNSEKPKSKIDIINEKMMQADKIQTEIDDLLNKMPEGQLKQDLQNKTKELHNLWDEVTKLISEEDKADIKESK